MSKRYHLFISHSWNYTDAYEKLIALLDKTGLVYSDYSVPKEDPVHTNGTDKELKDAIRRQMAPCNCILVLAGVYATYSKWINKEIEIAKSMKKKIIAIEPFGSERTSRFVKENADIIVKWRGESIKNAIEQ
ncbi:MAG: TIR domain-containing protein [Akkermansia sp.]|nr:TIR domain-containing protein [Akkermansia sp.]